MWRSNLIFLLTLFSFATLGQVGNEWIEPAQSYYKIKVGKDGFYRITQEQLQAAGFPIATVPASRIQLFRRGEEVALNVNTNTDGTLNYLEFYGKRNDGTGDSPLYDAGGQPHTFYNLFSDTAAYFLTYKLSNENGKRMTFSSDKNATGLAPEAFHMEDTMHLLTSNYSPGVRFGSGASFSLSKYDNGEGWTGGFQSKNAFKDFNFNLRNFVSSAVNPSLEVVLIGGNSLSHNVQISIGENTSSLSVLDNVTFESWNKAFYSGSFAPSNVGGGGSFVARITAVGFPETSERISVAYVRLKYPQSIEMAPDENKLFTLAAPQAAKAWLHIATTNASGTRIFDVSDPFNAVRLATTNFSDRVEVVVPGAFEGQRILAVTNPESVTSITPVTLPDYDLSDRNYLIITHPQLRQSGDPVAEYKNYRESVAGGSYRVHIANIDDLFNLYNYGDPSPLAIRNYIIDANSQNSVNYVFIIGKGFTLNYNYYRGPQTEVNVPTYGLPGGDLMYTLGIDSDPQAPGIPVGRLNAVSPGDVTSYLNKVIEMEALPFDDLFRKDFLQLSGGINKSEIDNFVSIVQGFTSVLEGDYLGGRAFNTGKETSEAVEFVDVTDRVNKGVGYVTFFGHSSGTVTDIEIGRVSDPSFGFSNKGKYPIFLVNGCKAGEIFGTNFTFGEDWLLTPDLGAVGFIAHSDVAISSTLKAWSDLYYSLAFGDSVFIKESVGNVMKEVAARYLNQYGTDNLNLTQVHQMTLQGDPAYRVFGADYPDYFIDENALNASAVGGGEILATQDSFKVEMVVKNFGRTVLDSLIVQITRTFPDGSQEVYAKRYERPLRQDTLTCFIPMDFTKTNEGVNLLTISLDPTNLTREIDETNNIATLEVPIFRGNTVHLYPLDNATQSSSLVSFIWQSSNLLEEERTYELEIDTQADFAGPNNRSFNVSGEVLASQSFDFSVFSLPDTATIYWRTRFANPGEGETNEWVSSSFTLINTVDEGWGQYTPEQVETSNVKGVTYNQLTNRWEFIENTTPIEIFTFGVDNAVFSYEDMRAIIGGLDFFVTSNTIDPVCESNTFNAIAFDKESGDPYRPIVTTQIDVFNREVCGRLPQRIYQFREQDMIGASRRFQFLVDNMKVGDPIVMFNIGEVLYSNWDADVSATLAEVGVGLSSLTLTDGQPVIFFGRKGDPVGSATVIINNGSSTPVREQSLELQDNVISKFESGEIRSLRIGPARTWKAFSYRIDEETNDNITLDVYGVDASGNLTSLVSRGRAETIDIAGTDATVYPQLELAFGFSDAIDQTPAQLNFWEVNYDYPPEGILLPDGKDMTTLLEGAEITRDFFFYNISSIDFSDSLTVMVTLINQQTGETDQNSFQIAPPAAGDTTNFRVSFSSFDKEGLNSLLVEVQANENEVYTTNNRLTLANLIEVKADETNPVLDVTFDGYHILNGDIVSPNPQIVIKMRDDNPFAFKADTTGINISLKLPGEESQFQRISFSDPRLRYAPATESEDFRIEYEPGPLEDGTYTLRVQAEDGSGNEAGSEPYEINFEVITESTVTHFYPYPNPFSTNCRFIFTLTGSELPDQIKIQILTVSGRVVREITQDEIGPVRIGNNITQYAWDGRDEYGDQLANGVYFYKVFINSGGNTMEKRSTKGDRAFKNGFGKLYILR